MNTERDKITGVESQPQQERGTSSIGQKILKK